MKIVLPYAKIVNGSAINSGVNIENEYSALRYIESCGRVSHRSEDAQTNETWKRFIEAVVIGHGDWSIVEHVSISVDIMTDRGITHELVRHRLFSFTQESTRFVNYEKKMPPSFIYPKPDVQCESCLAGSEPYYSSVSETNWIHSDDYETLESWTACAYESVWLAAIAKAAAQYRNLVTPESKGGRGWRPQEARSVFPNALSSRMIMTGNLRNWRHFLIMRTTKETHPQLKQFSIPLLKEFQGCFPILFDDIIPEQQQAEALKKAR
jgi:thymidylate synthase (FAD)